MNILIYENSTGFSSYSYKLCNGLIENDTTDVIYYLTGKNNQYLCDIDKRINVIPILKSPNPSIKSGVRWLFDRIYVGLANIIIRNKFVKKNNIDLLNVQSTLPVLDQFFLGKLVKRIHCVLTVHDVIPPIKSFYWSYASLKRIYDIFPRLIVHSKENKNELIEKFGVEADKISVIHHGTDIKFCEYPREKCLEHLNIQSCDRKIFLFFGLIREQKGLDLFIEAINSLNAVSPVCMGIIAGAMPRGESFEKYNELIKNKEDFVCHIEYIDEELVDYLFQAADAVVFPYKYFSSQSGVFMQSIKYRKPIIATDVSSFRQYIEFYGIGKVTDHINSESLSKSMTDFINIDSQELENIKNGLEQAARDNSWERAAELYKSEFDIAFP